MNRALFAPLVIQSEAALSVRMATPFKHPRTGVDYILRAVPKDIRETFGKSQFLKSLGANNDREAKLLFPAALQESDAAFARARGRLAAVDVLDDVQIAERDWRQAGSAGSERRLLVASKTPCWCGPDRACVLAVVHAGSWDHPQACGRVGLRRTCRARWWSS